MNLFDMVTQNQQGMEALSRQFNLSQQQTQAALEALLPAFSQGLRQNASDPYGLGSFLQALSSGRHANYFDNPANAFSAGGMAEGNGILGHLFGSKDLSRAVAAQAAQATGIGQQLLQQMLPAIAAMIMGGLFKQSTNQFQPQAQPMSQARSQASGNPIGDIIEQMMRQGMGGGAAQPRSAPPAANPFDNPFGKILQDMLGGGAAPEPTQRTQPRQAPADDNPLGRIFEEMMGGRRQQPEPVPEPVPEPTRRRAPDRSTEPTHRTNPSGRARTPYDDLFGDMFDAGRKSTDTYQKGMESIFEQFTRGMDRYR